MASDSGGRRLRRRMFGFGGKNCGRRASLRLSAKRKRLFLLLLANHIASPLSPASPSLLGHGTEVSSLVQSASFPSLAEPMLSRASAFSSLGLDKITSRSLFPEKRLSLTSAAGRINLPRWRKAARSSRPPTSALLRCDPSRLFRLYL